MYALWLYHTSNLLQHTTVQLSWKSMERGTSPLAILEWHAKSRQLEPKTTSTEVQLSSGLLLNLPL